MKRLPDFGPLVIFVSCITIPFGLAILAGCFGPARPSGPELPPGIGPTATPGQPTATQNGGATPGKEAAKLDPERAAIASLEGQLAQAKAALSQKQAQEQEREAAAWRYWSRWIAGLGIPLALSAGALGVWFGVGRIALPIAGAVVVFCGALLAFGESLPWLRFAAPIAGGLAVVGVALFLIFKQRRALVAGAHLGDALESGQAVGIAKQAAKMAQEAAGVWGLIQEARGKVKQ